MSVGKNQYRRDLDFVKGISILAVILYHCGFVRSGYLGVDVFLVINGFFIIPKLIKNLNDGSFRYFNFLTVRLLRLLPVLVVACVMCLVVGWIGMLPDDYENLSEQVFASSLFVNNILQAITTQNYWNVVNEFKPLMHTWYLGIIVQFYLTFPLILIIVKKTCEKINCVYDDCIKSILSLIALISFIMFLCPYFRASTKFYFLPFRYFEFLLGGLVGIVGNVGKVQETEKKHSFVLLLALIAILFYGIIFANLKHLGGVIVPIGTKEIVRNGLLLPNWLLVTTTCALTSMVVIKGPCILCKESNLFVYLGVRSYSFFIWHQIIFAFYRYFITSDINVMTCIALLFCVFMCSVFSFKFIEKSKSLSKSFVIIPILSLVVMCSLLVYVRAGVVRDVPELMISKNNVHRNMNSEYSDRVYKYDKDFDRNNGKMNVLVVGNSFARDWCNILLESGFAKDINISYHYYFDEGILERIEDSDYIFTFMKKEDVPSYVWNNIRHSNVWGIGTKNFGESNGAIYSRRFLKNYYDQKVPVSKPYADLNEEWRNSWGGNYVDLMQYTVDNNDKVRVFSDDHLLISQDCHHLTQGGARFFANKVDFELIFKK